MKKETSCINSRAILEYVHRQNHGKISFLLKDLDPEVDAMPDPESFLRDPNNWISCTVLSKMFERARLILNDDLAAYNAAKHAIEYSNLGYAQRIFVKTFWSTRKVLNNLQKVNDKWNRNKKVEVVKSWRKDAVVRLHWQPDMDSSKDSCLYNQGAYTFMPLVWGAKANTLKETCCYFEGAGYCEYHINFPSTNRIYEIISRLYTPKAILMDTIMEMEADKKIIEQKYEEVNHLNTVLNQKIKQILAIQETGKAILSVLDLKQLLSVIMNILSNVCRINRAIIMLVNETGEYLEYIYGAGFDGGIPTEIKKYRVSLGRVSNILSRVASTGKSEYIHEVKSSALRKNNIILARGKPTSAYVVPLITKTRVIGVFAMDAVDKMGIPLETRETLQIFAPQIAIAIENARLYSKMQEQMAELKRSQARLIRAEKFSFLGDLSTRLAHEIKNPLTAIGTFLQMLPQKYNDDEFRKEFFEIASEETARVNSLITELLNLSKKRESFFEYHHLHRLIDKMLVLISPQSNSKKIRIIRRYSPDIDHVWMDQEKIKEVILNLLYNAIEDSPAGGQIEIKTSTGNNQEHPEQIRIEVKDNGKGIPPSIIDNIFDPYFTTKHKSTLHSGTGLGLFIAYLNMKDHNGTIEVKSKVNAGTTFILKLPDKRPDGRLET